MRQALREWIPASAGMTSGRRGCAPVAIDMDIKERAFASMTDTHRQS
jgi:hypothetical protein